MTLGIWVLFYLLLTVLVGLFAARLIKNSSDFLSASRRLPLVLNASALFALWFGSETVLGASSEFINHGILGVIEDPFGGFLCLILFGLFFARRLYRQNLVTLGDLFRQVYGPRVERLSSVFMIITFFGYVAAQIIALGILFHIVFGTDETAARLISAAIVTIYTMAGGMWSVSITDFMQSIFIVLGLVLIAIFLTDGLAIPKVFHAPKANFFDFIPNEANKHSWVDYIAAWSALSLGSLASQDIFQRVNAARSERTAVRSTYLGAIFYLTFAMFPLYLGLLVYQLAPELINEQNNQHTLMSLIALHAPMWLQVLFYGALISAIFSTCSGAILAPASLLAENILKPAFSSPISDRRMLRLSRISVVLIAMISTVLALNSDSIYELVSQSSILGLVAILTPMTAALYLPRYQHVMGAYLSMILGVGSYFLVENVSAFQIFPSMFIGLGFSILGLLLGHFLSKRKK